MEVQQLLLEVVEVQVKAVLKDLEVQEVVEMAVNQA